MTVDGKAEMGVDDTAPENSQRGVPSPPEQPRLDVADGGRSITWRSVGIGILLAALIAAVTPYNDNVRHNTYLVGNFLPITFVSVIFLLCVVVNPLLGTARLAARELAVSLGMMLFACAVPSSGLLRFFEPGIIGALHMVTTWSNLRPFMRSVPRALMPTRRPDSRLATNGWLGIAGLRHTSVWSGIGAWVSPYLWWGFFFTCMLLCMVFFVVIMRRQWVVNEKLSFPLAAIQLEMLAEPEGGRRLNALWRSKSLWIGIAIPFLIHILNGIHMFTHYVPAVPLKYDFSKSFGQFPWNTLSGNVTSAQLYFTVVGATYFVSQEVAFSCWFFFLAYQVGSVLLNGAGHPMAGTDPLWQSLGATVAYGILLFWIARRYLAGVVRAAVAGDPRLPDEFLSYRWSVIGFLAFFAGAVGFFVWFGVPWWFGFLIVFSCVFACMILTRIVIDAGLLTAMLPYGGGPPHFMRFLMANVGALNLKDWFFQVAAGPLGLTRVVAAKVGMTGVAGWLGAQLRHAGLVARGINQKVNIPAWKTDLRGWMMFGMTNRFVMADQRENIMPFAANALRINAIGPARSKRATLLWLAAALLFSLALSGFVHHLIDYQYGTSTFDQWTSTWSPYSMLSMPQNYAGSAAVAGTNHHGREFLLGAAGLAIVGIARLFWVDCPLHPIGLILLNAGAMYSAWFSMFVGWLLKYMLLRYGGADTYRRAKPFFIGLIVGESLAGMVWILVGLAGVHWPGGAYQVLPG